MNEVTRGEEAEYLLNHEIIKDAFGKVRTGIVSAMTESAMGDERTHNRLVIAMQLLEQIERNIQEVATTGKLARLQVKQGVVDTLRRASGF